MARDSFSASILLSLAAFVVGCGKPPQLAEVEGTISFGGKLLDDVDVQFLPDPEKDNLAQISTGITDIDGRFVVRYLNNGKPGAAVGWHRIVLLDNKVYDRENPQPSRFDSRFNLAATTPIHVEVKPGKQNLEIDLVDYPRAPAPTTPERDSEE